MTKIVGIIQLKGGSGRSTVTDNLSEDIHKKLKHAAVDQDTTATAIIEELLAKHL